MLRGFPSTLNGPATSTVAVSVPSKFLGSRHESEQVPPHPYLKLKVLSYVASLLLMRSFGAEALLPLRVMEMDSFSFPFRVWLKLRCPLLSRAVRVEMTGSPIESSVSSASLTLKRPLSEN